MKGMCLNDDAMGNPGLTKEALKSARHLKDDLKFADQAVILSKGWTMVRHAVSGELMERRLVAQFMVKNPKNTCYSYETVMAQQHTGNNNWSSFYIKEGNIDGKIFNSTWKQASCRCLNK
jgi:hypothetical protein